MKKFLRSRFFNEYGMVFVLLGLVAYFAAGTWEVQYPENTGAAENLAEKILKDGGANQKPPPCRGPVAYGGCRKVR